MRRSLTAILGAGAMIAALAVPGALSASEQTPAAPAFGLLPGAPAGEKGNGLAAALGGTARDSAGRAARTLEQVKDTVSGVVKSGEDRGARPRGGQEARRAAAKAAASSAVDIRDFSYKPRTISVAVGDTVEWTNFDQAPHDADAFDGSFDTPVLQKGESSSVTFDDAGSFKYFCSVHPPDQFPDFTGKVIVGDGGGGDPSGSGGGDSSQSDTGGGSGGDSGATGSTGGSSNGAGAEASGGSSGPTNGGQAGSGSGGSRLASTGHGVLSLAVTGLALLALGALATRRRRITPQTGALSD